MSATLLTSSGMSLSMMPPCIVARVGFWCFLAMLTPSTMTLPLLGSARMTTPCLPRSLPWSTTTRSPFLIFMTLPPLRGARPFGQSAHRSGEPASARRRGVGARPSAIADLLLSWSSQDFRCERDDAHELLVSQLATDRTEDAGASRLHLVVDEDGGVLVEADVAAVGTALLLLHADDDALHDVALLDRGAGHGVLHGRHEDVADSCVAPTRTAEHLDAQHFARPRVVGHLQPRLLLDHRARSSTST